MNLSRFQVAINHDDPDIVSQGLNLFRERILADHGAEQSFGYHGRDLDENRAYVGEVSYVGGRHPSVVTGLLQTYLRSSPMMDELFVLWGLPGRDEDPTLVQAHTHCLAAILHCAQSDHAACTRLVARILTDFSKSLVSQLGINNQGIVHSTLGLLLAICRSSDQNCRDCYHRVIGHTAHVNHLLQKGKEVQYSVGLPSEILDGKEQEENEDDTKKKKKISTDSRYLMCMLVLVVVLYADSEIAQEVLTAYGGRSLFSRVMNGLPHDPSHTLGFLCRGLTSLLQAPALPLPFKLQLLDSASVQKLLQLYASRGGEGDVIADLIAALLAAFAEEIAAGLRGGGGGGGAGSPLAKAHLLIRFVHPHLHPALHTSIQPLLMAKPSLLAPCVAALSAAPGLQWDALTFCEEHLAALSRLCHLLETTAVDATTKHGVAAILQNKKSDAEIKSFVTNLFKSFLPAGLTKKDFSKLLLEPTNPLLQRMGLLLFQNAVDRLARCTRDTAMSGTGSNTVASSGSGGGKSKLHIYMLSVSVLFLPDIQLVFALRARYLKALMDTRVQRQIQLSAQQTSSEDVVEKQAQSIYFTQLSLSLLESVLRTLPTMISSQSNFNITKLLDEIAWVINDVANRGDGGDVSTDGGVSLSNALNSVHLVEKTLNVLHLATNEHQCKWFGTQGEVVKALVNTMVSPGWTWSGSQSQTQCQDQTDTSLLMLGSAAGAKQLTCSPLARLLLLCTAVPYQTGSGRGEGDEDNCTRRVQVRSAAETIRALANSLLALVLQQSGLFQGHGQVDLEMAAERNGWLTVIRELTATVMISGVPEEKWADSLRSHLAPTPTASKSNRSGKKQQKILTFTTTGCDNNTLQAYVSMLDLLLRVAFHWNTALALAAHSFLPDVPGAGKDSHSHDHDDAHYRTASPFSPVICAALALQSLDFSSFLPSFPNHVKAHVLARQAGEPVDTESNFLTNFKLNFLSLLEPMFDKLFLGLLPWTPQPSHFVHSVRTAVSRLAKGGKGAEALQHRLTVYAALAAAPPNTHTPKCAAKKTKATKKKSVGKSIDEQAKTPLSASPHAALATEASGASSHPSLFFASKNVAICVHRVENLVGLAIGDSDDDSKEDSLFVRNVFGFYWANIASTLCRQLICLQYSSVAAERYIAWIRAQVQEKVVACFHTASFEAKLSFLSFCLRLLFELETYLCPAGSDNTKEAGGLGVGAQTRKRTRASSIASNDSVASSIISPVIMSASSSISSLPAPVLAAAQGLCDDLVAVVEQVVTSTAAGPLTLSALAVHTNLLVDHFMRSSPLGRRCLRLLCTTARTQAQRKSKKGKQKSSLASGDQQVHPLWTAVLTVLKTIDISAISGLDRNHSVSSNDTNDTSSIKFQSSDSPAKAPSLYELCWSLQSIVEDDGLRQQLIDIVVDTSTGHSLTSLSSPSLTSTATGVLSSLVQVGPMPLSVLKSASIQSMCNAFHSFLESSSNHEELGNNALIGVAVGVADGPTLFGQSSGEPVVLKQIDYYCEVLGLLSPSSLFNLNACSQELMSSLEVVEKFFFRAKMLIALSPAAKGLVFACLQRLEYSGAHMQGLLALELSHICSLPLISEALSLEQRHAFFTTSWAPAADSYSGNPKEFLELVNVMLARQELLYHLDKKTCQVMHALKELLLLMLSLQGSTTVVVNIFAVWMHASSPSSLEESDTAVMLRKFQNYLTSVLVPVTLFHCAHFSRNDTEPSGALSARWDQTLVAVIALLCESLTFAAKAWLSEEEGGAHGEQGSCAGARMGEVVRALDGVWALPLPTLTGKQGQEQVLLLADITQQKCCVLLNKSLKTCLKFGLCHPAALSYIHRVYQMTSRAGPCPQVILERGEDIDCNYLAQYCSCAGQRIIHPSLILEMMIGHSKFTDAVHSFRRGEVTVTANLPLLRLLLYLLGLCNAGNDRVRAKMKLLKRRQSSQTNQEVSGINDEEEDVVQMGVEEEGSTGSLAKDESDSEEEESEDEEDTEKDDSTPSDLLLLPHESALFLSGVLLQVYCGTMAETDRIIMRIFSSLEHDGENNSCQKRGDRSSHSMIFASTPVAFNKSKEASGNNFHWVTNALKPPGVYATLAQFPAWRSAMPQPLFFEDASRRGAYRAQLRAGLRDVRRGQKRYEAQEAAWEEARQQQEKRRREQRKGAREANNPFSRANILRREEEQWFAGSTPEVAATATQDGGGEVSDSEDEDDGEVSDQDELQDQQEEEGSSGRSGLSLSSIQIDRLHRASGSASQVLDPAYWVPAIYFCLHLHPDLSMRIFANCGALSLLLAALSCECTLLRAYALAALQIVVKQLRKQTPDKDSTFRERPQLLVIVSFIRNSIIYASIEDGAIAQGREEEEEMAAPGLSLRRPVPLTSAIFLARAALHVLQPQHPLFASTNKYLLSRPFLDVKDLPLYDLLVIHADVEVDTGGEERLAALRLLRDSLGSREDHLNMCRKNAYGRLLVYFTLFAHDVKVLHAVLDVLERCLSQQASARYLLERCSLVAWLQQVISPLNSNSIVLTHLTSSSHSSTVHADAAGAGRSKAGSGYLAAPVRLLSRCVMLLRRTLQALLLLSKGGGGVLLDEHLHSLSRTAQIVTQEVILIGKGKMNTEATLPFDFFFQLVCTMWDLSAAVLSRETHASATASSLLWSPVDLQELAKTCSSTYAYSSTHHSEAEDLVFSILLLQATHHPYYNHVPHLLSSGEEARHWAAGALLSLSTRHLVPSLCEGKGCTNGISGIRSVVMLHVPIAESQKGNRAVGGGSSDSQDQNLSSILDLLMGSAAGQGSAVASAGSCVDPLLMSSCGASLKELEAGLKDQASAEWMRLSELSFYSCPPIPLSFSLRPAALVLTAKSLLLSLLTNAGDTMSVSEALQYTRWALVMKKCFVDDAARGGGVVEDAFASYLLSLCERRGGGGDAFVRGQVSSCVTENFQNLLDLTLLGAIPLLLARPSPSSQERSEQHNQTRGVIVSALNAILRCFSTASSYANKHKQCSSNGGRKDNIQEDLLSNVSTYLHTRSLADTCAKSVCGLFAPLLEGLGSLLSVLATCCDRDTQDLEEGEKDEETRRSNILEGFLSHTLRATKDSILDELLNERLAFVCQTLEKCGASTKHPLLTPPVSEVECCDQSSPISLWTPKLNHLSGIPSQHQAAASSHFTALLTSSIENTTASAAPCVVVNRATGRASKTGYHRGRAQLIRCMTEARDQHRLQQMPVASRHRDGVKESENCDDVDDMNESVSVTASHADTRKKREQPGAATDGRGGVCGEQRKKSRK